VTEESISSSASGESGPEPGQHEHSVLIIQGVFDPPGEKLLRLSPVRRHAWRSGPLPNQRSGRFAVHVEFTSGRILTVPFDALVAADAETGDARHGFFEVIIPVTAPVERIRIADAGGQRIYAVIEKRDIPP